MAGRLIVKFLQGENSVCTAKTKAIGQRQIDIGVVDALADDRIIAHFWVESLDIRRRRDKRIVHH